jgi:hypothetical protein
MLPYSKGGSLPTNPSGKIANFQNAYPPVSATDDPVTNIDAHPAAEDRNEIGEDGSHVAGEATPSRAQTPCLEPDRPQLSVSHVVPREADDPNDDEPSGAIKVIHSLRSFLTRLYWSQVFLEEEEVSKFN